MSSQLSPRLAAIVDALPLKEGLRVLEIGSGTGAAARAVAGRVGQRGFVLGIDRSATAIAQSKAGSGDLLAEGRLDFRQAAAETFELLSGEAKFDLAFAVRVGALDGRHPAAGEKVIARLRAALVPDAPLFIDGGNPLRMIDLDG